MDLILSLTLNEEEIAVFEDQFKIVKELKLKPLPSATLDASSNAEITNNLWIASALFISAVLLEERKKLQGNIKLLGLLNATNVRISDFFENVSLIIARLPESSIKATENLKSLKQSFVISTLVFDKYNLIWSTCVQWISTQASNEDKTPIKPKSRVLQELFTFGWRLFILAKSKIFGQECDLATSYHLLIAVVYFILCNSTVWNHNHKVETASNPLEMLVASASIIENTFFPRLCELTKTSSFEVGAVNDKLIPFIKQLSSTSTIHGRINSYSNDSSILSNKNLPLNDSILSQSYEKECLLSIFDFDETLFLRNEIHDKIGTPRKSVVATPSKVVRYNNSLPNTPSKSHKVLFPTGSSPPSKGTLSPFGSNFSKPVTPFTKENVSKNALWGQSPIRVPVQNAKVHSTPVSAAVEASTWVRKLSVNEKVDPSPALLFFFKECEENVELLIEVVLKELKGKFISSKEEEEEESGPFNTNTITNELYKQGTTLYYNVLENMLKGEETRLGMRNFNSLLTNNVFHRALIACSFEAVIITRNFINKAYPKILDTCGVSAYDFHKVIDSFIRFANDLPLMIRRHLQSLEESIIEKQCWSVNSKLYEEMALVRDSETSPASLTHSKSVASKSLETFFRKLFSICATRIHNLTSNLDINEQLQNQIWTALKFLLEENNFLLVNRHIDHILLCLIYGVCKVNNKIPEVTFKNILNYYKLQNKQVNHTEIVRDIDLSINGKTEEGRGDIIKFYNNVFIPNMKAFLVKLTQGSKGEGHQQVAIVPFPKASPLPNSKIYLSPSSTPRRQELTPRTKILWSFGESPSCGLKQLNRSLNMNNEPKANTNNEHKSNTNNDTNNKRSFEDTDMSQEKDSSPGPSKRMRSLLQARHNNLLTRLSSGDKAL